MVASVWGISRYNWTNKVRSFCFIVFCGGMLASAAGVTSPIVSVVRVGPNGHLIRVLQPVAKLAQTTQQPRVNDQPISAALTPNESIHQLVEDAAKRYRVDPLLVHSVIHAESNFNSQAVSAKGAQGLMQLIPSTAERFGVLDPFDPKQNIDGGVRYLKYLQDRFPTDLTLSIAAYNAGEGAVTKYKTVPPYRETLGYVERVSREYRGLKVEPPSAMTPVEQTGPVEEPIRHIEQVFDAEGRLYLRTR